jgi:hypothetical protein
MTHTKEPLISFMLLLATIAFKGRRRRKTTM